MYAIIVSGYLVDIQELETEDIKLLETDPEIRVKRVDKEV